MRFFIEGARSLTKERKLKLIQQNKRLSKQRKCELLSINRSGLYYKPKPVKDIDQKLKQEIFEIYTKQSFYGYRKIHALLKNKGYSINKKKYNEL